MQTTGGASTVALLSTEQRIQRLEARVHELGYWVDRSHADLERWSFDGEPMSLGEPWPDLEGVHVFAHRQVSVPEGWPLAEVRLELDVGGEGLVRIRYEDGSEDAWGHDPYHRRWALEQRSFTLGVEAVARLGLGTPNRGARLTTARLVRADVALEALERRLRLLLDAARTLAGAEVTDPLLECGERAVASLQWPSGTQSYVARTSQSEWMRSLWTPPEGTAPRSELNDEQHAAVEAAEARLERDVRELVSRYPSVGAIALTGHAHLDVAWLWPLEETRRKAVRSFHTAAGLLGLYGEFRFNQSSAQVYSFVEEDDPALFERVRKLVAERRWEPIGGMWVEPDMNMTAGESIVRQLLYGQRYFAARFGSTHDVCWLPDCFGFSPALPQLLVKAGITNFVTIKVNWSEVNRFPYDLFWWEGIDGSRVLAHTFDNPELGYNGNPGPGATVATWVNYRGKHKHPESLLSIGHGDGGGGVTEEMLMLARAAACFPRLPRLRFTRVDDYFEQARAAVEGEDVPTWVGELYLEYHRGTLTTQGRIKRAHRRAERDLVAAEVTGAMAALAGDKGVTPRLEDLWLVLLRNQFHDILPGSGIAEIYQASAAELDRVIVGAREAIGSNLERLARNVFDDGEQRGVMVVNPDLSARPLRAHLERSVLGAQEVDGGYVLSGPVQIPGLAAAVVVDPPRPAGLDVSPEHLDNEFLRVVLSGDGTIASIYDKRADREVLAGRGNQLWAYVDKPRAFDAWEIDVNYTDSAHELPASSPPVVTERGPHRIAVAVERRFRDSRVVQHVRLWSNSARLEFATMLDWHDRHWMIKSRWPLAVRSTHATFETAFGVVQRPTYRNTTWDAAQFEVAGHRFADLSEPGYGAAIVNDGRYGHHCLRNELGLTLLRSPAYPDPRADEGTQEIVYALVPHSGDWLAGGVLAEAEDLNRPLLIREVSVAGAQTWRAVALDGIPLGLGALKVAEDDDALVLRTYEPRGARGAADLDVPSGWSLDGELDLLESPTGPAQTSFGPFEVHSWRISRRDEGDSNG
jgi:alpha-mannosidase